MNIPKHKAAEYLGIRKDNLSKLIKAGHLKNADMYHITLDSLVNYKASKIKPAERPYKRKIVTMSIHGMRKNGNTLEIDFTTETTLFNFADRLYKIVDVRIKGVQS